MRVKRIIENYGKGISICACIGGFFLVALGILGDVKLELFGFTTGLGIIAIGVSFIALGGSISSEQKMMAITKLNFYEKMAMIEDYMGCFCGKDGFETLLKRIRYDINAESALKPWADRESLEKLITSLIQIIECAQKKDRDANGAYTEDICNLIEIALEINPENKVLQDLKSKCPPSWQIGRW